MLPELDAEDVCLPCLEQEGLCQKHTRDVCPQLAKNIGWLKLMGSNHADARKVSKPASVSEQQKGWRERRDAARSASKKRKKGARGALFHAQARAIVS